MPFWAIIDAATGKVTGQAETRIGRTPADDGWPVDGVKSIAYLADRRGDLQVDVFNIATGKWEQSAAAIEARLIERIKDEAERRRMMDATPGGMKKTVYAAKQAEVEAYNALGSSVTAILAALSSLSAVKRTRKFRFALAEAALRGEANIEAAINRFAAGADRSNAMVARIEAIEQVAVDKIKAATTAAAKQAAYDAVAW